MAAETIAGLRPNGNVTASPNKGTVTYDWPDVHDFGVDILRGAESIGMPVLHFQGSAIDIADYLAALADVVTRAAGLRVCGDCGFRYDPERRGDADDSECGSCSE